MTEQQPKSQNLFDRLGFVPGNVIRLFGMRRSGNHALVNWLQRNQTVQHVFLNNCAPGRCPTKTVSSLEINGDRCPIKKDRKIDQFTRAVPDGATLIISYEDYIPDPNEVALSVTPSLPKDVSTQDIVLFRSFMNWSASLLRKLQNNDQEVFDRLRIMMVSLDRYRDALELVAAKNEGFLPIHYDRWVAREQYRRSLLDRINLKVVDNALGEVQPYGGGSSFQRDASEAAELATTDRWQLMVNEPDYQIILLTASQDAELVQLIDKVTPKDGELLKSYLEQARFPYLIHVAEDG